jgi:hypothetical protein
MEGLALGKPSTKALAESIGQVWQRCSMRPLAPLPPHSRDFRNLVT